MLWGAVLKKKLHNIQNDMIDIIKHRWYNSYLARLFVPISGMPRV